MSEDLFLKSTYYEKLVEHVFISEILQEVWYRHEKTVEVLRSEVDASGFDVVLECENVMRHIQLKTSRAESKTSRQPINIALAQKPGGCVVWLVRSEDRASHRMTLDYLYFGGGPGEPLSRLHDFPIGRRTRVSASGERHQRPAIREVPKKAFRELTISELAVHLFGVNASNI